VVVYAAQAAGAWDAISPFLVTGPASALLEWFTFAPGFSLVQGLAVAGVATACVAFLTTRARASVSIVTGGILAVGATTFVAGFVTVGSMGSDARYHPVSSVELRCVGVEPIVCFDVKTVRPMLAMNREIHRLRGALVGNGIAIPTRFVEWSPLSS